MCECGCSQGPDYFFPGPDGVTYGLELYRGCNDCGEGPGVALFRIPNDRLSDFAPAGVDRHGPPWVRSAHVAWSQFAVPVMNRKRFTQVVRGDEYGDLWPITDDAELSEEVGEAIAAAAQRALIAVAWRAATTEGDANG